MLSLNETKDRLYERFADPGNAKELQTVGLQPWKLHHTKSWPYSSGILVRLSHTDAEEHMVQASMDFPRNYHSQRS